MTPEQFEKKLLNLAVGMYIGGGIIGVLAMALSFPWPVMLVGGVILGGLVGEAGRRYAVKIAKEIKEKGVV